MTKQKRKERKREWEKCLFRGYVCVCGKRYKFELPGIKLPSRGGENNCDKNFFWARKRETVIYLKSKR